MFSIMIPILFSELISPCSTPVKDHIHTLMCIPFRTECCRMYSSIPVRSVVSCSIHTTALLWSSEMPALKWCYRRFILVGKLDQVVRLGIHISWSLKYVLLGAIVYKTGSKPNCIRCSKESLYYHLLHSWLKVMLRWNPTFQR